jgi:TRAP-type C4-dicarboxylate transport system substrate-binding protein
MKKSISILAIAALLTICFAGFASPVAAKDKPVVLKMITFLPDTPPGNIWPHILKDKVAVASKGELEIKFIGGPEAIPITDAPSAVQAGVIDMASVLLTFAESMVPGIEAIELAEYNSKELRENGAIGYVRELFAKSGIYYLGVATPTYPQQLTALFFKKEIKSIEDIRGLKIAAAGGSHKAFFETLGATCVPISFADMFTAMERGVVDGFTNGIPGVLDLGLQSVTGYFLDEMVASPGTAYLMNLKKYNSLPQHLKDALNQAVTESDDECPAIFHNLVEKIKKEDFVKAGINTVKFNHDDSVKFYKTFRESMAAEALKRSPKILPNLLELIQNPDFERLK